MMKILSSHCLTKLIEDVKSELNNHYFYSIFRGKTSHMSKLSKLKQFSISVSYLNCEGAKQETGEILKVNK